MSQFISEEIRAIDIPFENAIAKASETLKVDLAKMTPIDRLNYLVDRIVTAETPSSEPEETRSVQSVKASK
jgi:hypothetical protein